MGKKTIERIAIMTYFTAVGVATIYLLHNYYGVDFDEERITTAYCLEHIESLLSNQQD